MAVVDLAQERLMRAMVDTAVAASTGDSQKLSEKAEVMNKVIAFTDDATVRKVVDTPYPSIGEVVDTVTTFLRAVGEVGRLIERIRR